MIELKDTHGWFVKIESVCKNFGYVHESLVFEPLDHHLRIYVIVGDLQTQTHGGSLPRWVNDLHHVSGRPQTGRLRERDVREIGVSDGVDLLAGDGAGKLGRLHVHQPLVILVVVPGLHLGEGLSVQLTGGQRAQQATLEAHVTLVTHPAVHEQVEAVSGRKVWIEDRGGEIDLELARTKVFSRRNHAKVVLC